jgi:hypothetical protein
MTPTIKNVTTSKQVREPSRELNADELVIVTGGTLKPYPRPMASSPAYTVPWVSSQTAERGETSEEMGAVWCSAVCLLIRASRHGCSTISPALCRPN